MQSRWPAAPLVLGAMRPHNLSLLHVHIDHVPTLAPLRQDVSKELASIRLSVQEELAAARIGWAALFHSSMRKRLLIGVVVQTCQQVGTVPRPTGHRATGRAVTRRAISFQLP